MQLAARDTNLPQYTADELKNNIIVKLKNFRCYGEVELKIPINSVTLINGPSGSGKTTLFESFMFVMYDDVKKPERFDSMSCWGWIFIAGLKVYRQRKPDVLKVWKSNPTEVMYTGDEAQAVIDSIYGPKRIFLACSYLKQKEFSLFLGTSDNEKIGIIRNVGLRGSDFDRVKTPIKQKVASLNEQYIAIRAQLEMAIKNLQNFDLVNPSVVQHQIPENPAEVMEQVKSLRAKIDDLDKDFEEAIQREASVKLFNNQVDLAKSTQNVLNAELSGIKISELREKLLQIDAKLKQASDLELNNDREFKIRDFKKWSTTRDSMQAKLKACEDETNKSLIDLESKIGSKLGDRMPTIRSTLDEISKNLHEVAIMLGQVGCKTVQEAKTKLVEVESELSSLKQREIKVRADLDVIKKWQDENHEALKLKAERDQKKLSEERSKIEEEKTKLQKETQAKRLATKMECPGCKIMLRLGDDEKHLERCEPVVSGIGAMLGGFGALPKEDTSKSPVPVRLPIPEPVATPPVILPEIIFTERPNITTTHDDLIGITNSITSTTDKRDRLVSIISICETKSANEFKLEKKEDVVGLISLCDKYTALEKNLSELKTGVADHEKTKPEEVTETQGSNSIDKEALAREKFEVQESINKYHEISKSIDAEETKIRSFSNMIVDMIKTVGVSSLDVRKQKHTLQGQIDQLMHLNSASDLAGQRSVLDKTMKEKADQAKSIEKIKLAAERLLTKANEAERISLRSAIGEINSHLSKVLKRLFTNIPISVELTVDSDMHSESKDSQIQVFGIKIFYNNSEYSSSNQLSGGEKDRLSLAITLALSEKFKSPLLFLDETLSSLDPELKSEAVSMLKEYCHNRTCVVISHDEAEGMYNHVIRIKGK